MTWAIYYPTKAAALAEESGSASYVPSTGPSDETRTRIAGVFQRRSGGGRKRGYRLAQGELYAWRHDFEWLTDDDITAREAFQAASLGAPFEFDDGSGTLRTVVFVGASADGFRYDKAKNRAGFYMATEEMEEQPNVAASTATRFEQGFLDFTGATIEQTVDFSSDPMPDGYVPMIANTTQSDDSTVGASAEIVYGEVETTGFKIRLTSGAPGAGKTVRVYWYARYKAAA